MNRNFICKGPGSGDGSGNGQYGCYQVLGNLHLYFLSEDIRAPVTHYHRELNLNDAVAHMEFTRGGITFSRLSSTRVHENALRSITSFRNCDWSRVARFSGWLRILSAVARA